MVIWMQQINFLESTVFRFKENIKISVGPDMPGGGKKEKEKKKSIILFVTRAFFAVYTQTHTQPLCCRGGFKELNYHFPSCTVKASNDTVLSVKRIAMTLQSLVRMHRHKRACAHTHTLLLDCNRGHLVPCPLCLWHQMCKPHQAISGCT